MKKPKVITISAVSGGGKTTLIDELKKRLPLAQVIYFDDYDFQECPDDLFQWVQNGADYNAWNSDFVVDGSLNLANIVFQVMEQISKLDEY